MKVTENLRQIVALSLVKDMGPIAFKTLIQEYKTPSLIFKALDADLIRMKELKRVHWKEIKNPNLFKKADEEIQKALKEKVRIITCFDGEYPAELKAIYDPPILLYVKGAFPDPALVKVAVVGSRVCSLYGKNMAHDISKELGRNNVVVVSGLALGIDSAAHEGALAADAITIAVLGGGISRFYPPENRKMAEKIIEKGAVISEYPMEMAPLREFFPVRNRIISGLSRGVLVVEAKERSGALITAHLALEEGREVFAVPGNADSVRSRGTNSLLKQGARLVTSAEDILEELRISKTAPSPAAAKTPAKTPSVGPEEEKILSLLNEGARPMDELIAESGLTSSQAIAALSLLEIKGLVKQLPGKQYLRP